MHQKSWYWVLWLWRYGYIWYLSHSSIAHPVLHQSGCSQDHLVALENPVSLVLFLYEYVMWFPGYRANTIYMHASEPLTIGLPVLSQIGHSIYHLKAHFYLVLTTPLPCGQVYLLWRYTLNSHNKHPMSVLFMQSFQILRTQIPLPEYIQ